MIRVARGKGASRKLPETEQVKRVLAARKRYEGAEIVVRGRKLRLSTTRPLYWSRVCNEVCIWFDAQSDDGAFWYPSLILTESQLAEEMTLRRVEP